MSDDKKIRILNRGAAPHVIRMKPKRTVLAPGMAAEVSAEEAKRLLAYPELVDMAKIIPGQEDDIAKLQKENEELKAKLASLAPKPKAEEKAHEEKAAPKAPKAEKAHEEKAKK